MILPKPLFPGARVALLCPSGAVPEERLAPSLEALCALGLQPVVYPSCRARHGYLAGLDALRADDLNRAFLDPSIDGILPLRGGYGANRILPLLDFNTIRQVPKYFGGYSDCTALHIAFNQLGGFITYHTVMPATEYYRPLDPYTMDHLCRAMFGTLIGPLNNPRGYPLRVLADGFAAAPLCGGNLSLLADSLGTPWEIDTRGKILFLEDVGEPLYRIDAMLTQLRNAGKFSDCAGILLGSFSGCAPEHPELDLSLDEIFRELLAPVGKPVLAGFACGHTRPTAALPLGAVLTMEATAKAPRLSLVPGLE
ncbi:MAG: LD-carboxypeptidase [Oscillospiraceae bacterium]|nr:LD-carboxypeptidase [Oscillospiraceae bacterium]